MLRFESSIIIEAPPDKVRNMYLDYDNWNIIFPLTISGTNLIKKKEDTVLIGVHHKAEGVVKNEIILKENNSLILKEWKPKYRAIFYNHFEPFGGNTIYRVEAFIYLNGLFNLIQPFLRLLAKHRLKSFVLIPLKKACEDGLA